MHDGWYPKEKTEGDINPQVQCGADLQSNGHGREEKAEDQFDYFHRSRVSVDTDSALSAFSMAWEERS